MDDVLLVRTAVSPAYPERDGASDREADHVVERSPPRAEEMASDTSKDLSRNRCSNDLDCLENNEHNGRQDTLPRMNSHKACASLRNAK